MNTTHFIQSAEIKDKYEGRYANVESFNRKFEARLTQRNPLAMAIVNGQIAVKEIKSPLSPLRSIFRQATSIMTQVMLAILVVMSVSEDERIKWTQTKKHRADKDYENLLKILAKDPDLKNDINTPIEQLAKEERKTIIGEREYLQQKQSHGYGYRSIIGGLSHLARRARPDIQFATFYLSRYQNDPGTSHFSAAKESSDIYNRPKTKRQEEIRTNLSYRYLWTPTTLAIQTNKNQPPAIPYLCTAYQLSRNQESKG